MDSMLSTRPVKPDIYLRQILGRYVVCRAGSDVYLGYLIAAHRDRVVLERARGLLQMIPRRGRGLAAIALFGLAPDSKLGTEAAQIYLTGVTQIIPVRADALRVIEDLIAESELGDDRP